MTQAAICSLESSSPEEGSLSYRPVLSFFTTSFAQCTKYVKQLTPLTTYGTVRFGHQLAIPLNKNDMIGRVYIIFTFPAIRHRGERGSEFCDSKHHYFEDGHHGGYDHRHGLSSSSGSSSSGSSYSSSSGSSSSSDSSRRSRERLDKRRPYVTWVDSLAHVVIESLLLQVAGVTINCHSGELMDLKDQITTKPGVSTNETVGRHRLEEDLWRASRREQQLTARVRFHFCESIGKALPVFAIYKSTVCLVLKLRPLKECYYSSDRSVPWMMDDERQIRADDIGVEVMANVYHLTGAERSQIYGEDQTHLMTQIHEQEVPFTVEAGCKEPTLNVKIDAKHPVSEMWFVIQKDDHLKEKLWYNYEGVDGEDPLERIRITAGGKELLPNWYGKWFRTIETMEHHNVIPKKHIYTLSYAICPDDETFHSGYYNFTANEDVIMHLTLQRGLGRCVFKIWYHTINLIRYKGGEIGLGWL
jgi:hypothetical protein